MFRPIPATKWRLLARVIKFENEAEKLIEIAEFMHDRSVGRYFDPLGR